MRRLLAASLFLLLFLAEARLYDGNCFDVVYPDVVQVARGNSTTFEIVIKNTGPYTELEKMELNITGQCSLADYPCEYEYDHPGNVLWNKTVEITLEMPKQLYDDPVKNKLYDETGRYIGYRREIMRLNSSTCDMERMDLLVKPLYGNELTAELDETEELEVLMDDLVIYKITLQNTGPEPFNVTLDEEGISHRRIEFDPPSLTLGPGKKANVFLNIDTTGMELGSKRARIYVETGALEDIVLVARFDVKAAGALAQRQFELHEELDEIEDDFERKISNATYNVTDVSRIRRLLSQTRELVTTGYLGVAMDDIPRIREEVEEMEPVYVEPEPEEVVVVEDLPDESRFRESELSVESFELFLRRYAWLIIMIFLLFGSAIGFVAYKGFFVPNTRMIKDARYVSDIEVKVVVDIVNKSMRSLKDVVLLEKIPQGFGLQSRFTSKGRSIPFTREAEPDGVSCRIDLSMIDPNSKIKIEYVMQKPRVSFGKLKIPPSTLNYTFRGEAQTLNSNVPQLGA